MLPPAPFVKSLLADPQSVDELLVAVAVLRLEIVEQTAPLADQLEQAAPRVVVLLVRLEVLGEVVDPLRQERHLHLGGPGVALVSLVLRDHVLLLRLVMQRPVAHVSFLLKSPHPPPARREGERAATPDNPCPEGRAHYSGAQWTSRSGRPLNVPSATRAVVAPPHVR